MGSYKQPWGSTNPGCLIILLDQSASMSDKFGLNQAGGGERKCDMVATILNGFLNELIVTNTVAHKDGTTEVRPRADVAVIGYEGSSIGSALSSILASKDFVTLPELQMNPITIEQRFRKEVDETGQVLQFPIPFPIWVTPIAGGGTPMCAALRHARNLAQEWTGTHPRSYPPVVINVTDGQATDGDPTAIAREISQISTSDGEALLFNVHITDINSAPVEYPSSVEDLPNDKYARLLFSTSSAIPDSSRNLLSSQVGKTISTDARGLIFNGDAASVRQMFVFASAPATEPMDPNR